MRVFVFAFLVALSVKSNAQTFKDVFDKNTEITWLGLDFTEVKIVGDEINWAEVDANKMFTSWNQLMINESYKYDMASALHRDKVKFALDVTIAHNKLVNAENLFVDTLPETYRLKKTDIDNIVSGYDFLGNSGIGVMFIMETLNKPAGRGSMCITFINMGTKEVLFTTRMASVPGGFGLRNFWASPVYRAIKKIDTASYREWRKAALKAK